MQAPELFALAARPDIESRLVRRDRGTWTVHDGPISRAQLGRLPRSGWTVLVQGVNLEVPAADALLRSFRFLPHARLDDVMVSYAVTGGGVGPHVDSYDVFLLQGAGRRRWSIARKFHPALEPGAPLKILRRFHAERDWVLGPGDMLYLPPGWAHDGVALEPCFTYSIGFRAPSRGDIAREFLAFLQDRVAVDGPYTDRGAAPARHAGEIPTRMVRHAIGAAAAIRWRARDVSRFLGEYLSEPKPRVVFSRPRRPLAQARFASQCRARGLRLDSRTRMLYRGRDTFINGERASAGAREQLSRLADERTLRPGERVPGPLLHLLHEWYLAGWLHIGESHG
ncbi:MAG TPA: cupin domain-containing protein [Burkholderiales bacterium]|nr:cupin domain-containing protein [Burkholderiales bacterium]